MPRYAAESSSAWSIRLCRSRANVAKSARTGRRSSSVHGRLGRRERDEQAERCEHRVDRERRSHRRQLAERRDPDHGACDEERRDEVEAELRRQRGRVDRDLVPRRRADSGHGQHERRADREPGGDDAQREPVDGHAAPGELRRRGEDERGADRERQEVRGDEEPHRDEHALGRKREAAGELELHPRGDGVADDRDHQRSERQRPIRGEEQQRGGDRQEQRGEQDRRRVALEMPRRARPAQLDDRVVAPLVG